jgi:hypothetical protein
VPFFVYPDFYKTRSFCNKTGRHVGGLFGRGGGGGGGGLEGKYKKTMVENYFMQKKLLN